MILATAGSFFHHVNGASFDAILIWWVGWIVLWLVWGFRRGTLISAVICIGVFALMLVGPRTHAGFKLQRDCFNSIATQAIAAHDSEAERPFDRVYRDDGRCGINTFRVATARVPFKGTNGPAEDYPVSVWMEGAGEVTPEILGGYGMAFSPGGIPTCSRGIEFDSHSCKLTEVGDGWYYYHFQQNIN